MAKKKEEAKQLELFEQVLPTEEQGTIDIGKPTYFKDAEWCFQFFDNEPVVFAWSADDITEPTPLVIQLQSHDKEGVSFVQKGMTFRIFPRPITLETIKQRDQQNANKNKETE